MTFGWVTSLDQQPISALCRGQFQDSPATNSPKGRLELRRTPFWRTSQNAASRHLDQAISTVLHPPKPGLIGQRVNAIGFAYANRCTLQPLVARQCRGRSYGIVYCLRTADKALDTNIVVFSFLRVLQAKKRADERTRTADLLITSDRSGVAGVCRGLQMPHI